MEKEKWKNPEDSYIWTQGGRWRGEQWILPTQKVLRWSSRSRVSSQLTEIAFGVAFCKTNAHTGADLSPLHAVNIELNQPLTNSLYFLTPSEISLHSITVYFFWTKENFKKKHSLEIQHPDVSAVDNGSSFPKQIIRKFSLPGQDVTCQYKLFLTFFFFQGKTKPNSFIVLSNS